MGERVNINVSDQAMQDRASKWLQLAQVDMSQVQFWFHPTDDAWCRDHGPAFLVNRDAAEKRMIVKWNYNAWGGKYPPFELDNRIPLLIAKACKIPAVQAGIVMEGGSVEFNGKGTLLTTTSCLLNPNRNPHLGKKDIEKFLIEYYGVRHILWLGDGIVGDDTDGHIDDLTRFVNADTVVTVIETNKNDENYRPLQENLKLLRQMRLEDGQPLNVVELPMPGPLEYEGQRLPASYANFYISNTHVIVPTYRDKNDDTALKTLEKCFPGRSIVGLDSTDIIWGLGSFHCLSQQEPQP